MSTNEKDCFGFYMGNPICNACAARQRCKAILISNGFDIVAASVDQMVMDLPANGAFKDTDRIPALVDQLTYPPFATQQGDLLDDDESELLNLLEQEELSKDDVMNMNKPVG